MTIMQKPINCVWSLAVVVLLAGCAARPAPQPRQTLGEAETRSSAVLGHQDLTAWQEQTASLPGDKVLHDDVYTITVQRDDLWVHSEIGDVPSAALASVIHFWLCTCGKGQVIGEFVVRDDEVKTTCDDLSAAGFLVTSLSPVLLSEHPRLLSIHFMAEGNLSALVKDINGVLTDLLPRQKPAGMR